MSSDTNEISEIPLSFHEKRMPSYWNLKRSPDRTSFSWSSVVRLLCCVLCSISFGHTDLECVWEAICQDEAKNVKPWESRREIIGKRLEHINVVVRLRLTCGDECFANFNYDVWLGWFVPCWDDGVLYHGSSRKREGTTIYDDAAVLLHLGVCFNRLYMRNGGVCCRVCASRC